MDNFPETLSTISQPLSAEEMEDIVYSHHDVHLGISPEGVLARDGPHPEDLE